MKLRMGALRGLLREAAKGWSCGLCGYDVRDGDQCARCGEPDDFGPDDGAFLPGYDPNSAKPYAFDVSGYDLGGFQDTLEALGVEVRNPKHPSLSTATIPGTEELGLAPGQTRDPERKSENRLPPGTFAVVPMENARDFVREIHDGYEDQEALWQTIRPKPPVGSSPAKKRLDVN